jgi:hypothetical protein
MTLIALSACTARYGGVPTAGDTLPEPTELTARSVFNDFTTVAPCSLTDPTVFKAFGNASFGEPESTLDYCTILIETATNASVTVSVGLLEELAASPDLDRKRDVEPGMWIGQRPGDTAVCSQVLVFPDDVTVEVYVYESAGEADTCSIAEAAMDHLLEVVLNGEVTHREPARNSLVRLDPCTLVTATDIAAIPALAGVVKPFDYPGKHKCRWIQGDVGVVVAFGAGPQPATTLPEAGRPTTITPIDLPTRSYCTVETAHIPFTEVPGVANQVELASVYVHLPAGQSAQACTAARTVAGVLWPKLPTT